MYSQIIPCCFLKIPKVLIMLKLSVKTLLESCGDVEDESFSYICGVVQKRRDNYIIDTI